jgi:hypothetical protein
MAKSRKSSVSKAARTGKWEPEPNDAINLATLRWYALTIDRLLIQIYCTDRSKQATMQAILDKAVRELYLHGKGPTLGDDGCPEGQRLCSDGFCAPMCMFE